VVADIFLVLLVTAQFFGMLSARRQASRAAYAVTAEIVCELQRAGRAACHHVTTIAHMFWGVKEAHPMALQARRGIAGCRGAKVAGMPVSRW